MTGRYLTELRQIFFYFTSYLVYSNRNYKFLQRWIWNVEFFWWDYRLLCGNCVGCTQLCICSEGRWHHFHFRNHFHTIPFLSDWLTDWMSQTQSPELNSVSHITTLGFAASPSPSSPSAFVREMSSELDRVGPERGRLLQLSSKVKQEILAGSGQDMSLSLLQESNQFGRGRLLEMSRMRHGGGGGGGEGTQGSRPGHKGQPKGILVIRWGYFSYFSHHKWLRQ